jgi:hypothetical protein
VPEGPATILGGLPVIAEVWYTRGDGWTTDDDAGVDKIYWQKRDGSKGKEISQKIYDRLDKLDYWESDVCDAVFDHLAYEQHKEENKCGQCDGTGETQSASNLKTEICPVCEGEGFVNPMVQLG